MDSSLMKFDSSVLLDGGNNDCPDSPFDPFEPRHLANAGKNQDDEKSESPMKFCSEYNNLFRKLKELQERSKKLLEDNTVDKHQNELETSIVEMKKDVSVVKNKLLEKVKNSECGKSPKRRFSSFKDDFGNLETSFNLIESSLNFSFDDSICESPRKSIGDIKKEALDIPFDVIKSECQKILDYIDNLKDESFELLSDEPVPLNISNSSEDEFGLPNLHTTKSSSMVDLSKKETIQRYRKLSLTLNTSINTEAENNLNTTFELKENLKPEIKDVVPIPVLPEVPKIVKKAEVRPLSRKGPLKAFAPLVPISSTSINNSTLSNADIVPKAASTPVTVTRQKSNPLMKRGGSVKVPSRLHRSSSASQINNLSNTSANMDRTTSNIPSKPNDRVRSTRSSILRANMDSSKLMKK